MVLYILIVEKEKCMSAQRTSQEEIVAEMDLDLDLDLDLKNLKRYCLVLKKNREAKVRKIILGTSQKKSFERRKFL